MLKSGAARENLSVTFSSSKRTIARTPSASPTGLILIPFEFTFSMVMFEITASVGVWSYQSIRVASGASMSLKRRLVILISAAAIWVNGSSSMKVITNGVEMLVRVISLISTELSKRLWNPEVLRNPKFESDIEMFWKSIRRACSH